MTEEPSTETDRSSEPDQDGAVLLTGGRRLSVDEVSERFGWSIRAEGLCRGDRCVLVPDRDALIDGDQVDVAVLAELLDRPFVEDSDSGLAAVGLPRSQRRSALDDLAAPDFALPDLDGVIHRLSDHRSKKRLLVAFSSW